MKHSVSLYKLTELYESSSSFHNILHLNFF